MYDVILQYLKKDDSLTLEELTQKFRDEGINVFRETVRRKLKQIRYASKVPVEGHELSLQQKEVRLKWWKSLRINTNGTNYSLHMKKLLKQEIRKREDGWVNKKKTYANIPKN